MGCGASAGTSEGKDTETPAKKAVISTVQRSPREYRFKIIIVGDSGVGKSSLLLQFTEGSFTEQYMTTLGIDFKMQTVNVEGDKVKLQLWDTAGQERFRTLNAGYYRGAAGIMVLYDVTSQESFNNVKQWFADVDRYTTSGDVGKVLVGNKTDLETERVIDYNTAKEYADDLGIPFIETSAKDFINVNEAFTALATAVKKIEDSKGQ